jgi:hypothetical protein
MKRLTAIVAAGLVAALAASGSPAWSAPNAAPPTTAHPVSRTLVPHVGKRQVARVERVGTTNVRSLAPGIRAKKSGSRREEFGPWLNQDDKGTGIRRTSSLRPPSPPQRPAQLATNRLGWEGLDHADQRYAGGGNQFSLEPPDQGLCVGGVSPNDPSYGPEVVESVNNAITFYDGKSNQLAPTLTLNEFYGLPPEIDRTTGKYGPSFSDPKCYFDVDTQRWFHSVLGFTEDPKTGALEAPSYLYFAVSTSADALGSYNIYRLDVTDAKSPNCPCFGDQPLIGADKYGFYISTAEYALDGPGFNGPQIYAFDKRALEAGSLQHVVHFSGLTHVVEGRTTGTVQPAMSPDAVFDTAANGTEYFLSSLDCLPDPACSVAPGQADHITVWALTNTRSLTTGTPQPRLSRRDLRSEVWGTPVAQRQKPGPTPLGDLVGEPLPRVDANDARMNQVVYAHGLLWGAINTVVSPQSRDGIAYFLVRPSTAAGTVNGTIRKQGYVSAAHSYLSYPSIGVNPNGRGVIAMSLMGPNNYPSAAQVRIDTSGVSGPVDIVQQGFRPEDGFTCYQAFVGKGALCRWGDYSASVGTPAGTVYSATEFIGDRARSLNANWSTFIWPWKR